MNILGVLIGLMAFLIIGVFHPIVIKAEYYLGVKTWPLFLIVGLVSIVVSLFIENLFAAASLGIFGFSCLWSIRELFEQAERVKKGWFPQNPDRK